MTGQEKASKIFKEKFGKEPEIIVRAPGRVNLIGEHTDYNDGFVMPMAIERSIWIALQARKDNLVKIYSANKNNWAEFKLDNIIKALGWLEYIKGVAHYLQTAGYSLSSWEGVVYGDIPSGAGLSSSAALELVSARAFFEVSNFTWNAKEMALLGQKVENDWLGLSSGIMDQLVVATAREGFASVIDCRSLEIKNYPMQNISVVILDTSTRRGLVDSKYNERFNECQKSAKILGIKALRDISLKDFEQNTHKLDKLLAKRARHVISENERVLAASQALQASDFLAFGKLMLASHKSLKEDYEASSKALDTMVDCATAQDSCYGARMTGAGFGGCAVALVQSDKLVQFKAAIAACYAKKTKLKAKIYVTNACNRVSTVFKKTSN